MKKSKVAKAVVSVAAGVTMAVMVGQIKPLNLNLVSKDCATIVAADFSANVTQQDCCGPYAQPCPSFQCAAPY